MDEVIFVGDDEPGSVRLLSVARLCNESWVEEISVKEGIDMTENIS